MIPTAARTDAQRIKDLEARHVVQTYLRAPFVLTHGDGVHLYDSTGREYLDLMAGIAVNALGYNDPELTAVISQQAAQLIHISNLYHTAPQAELAARLGDLSFADRVFFNNSGSEANETALKFARKYAKAHGYPQKVGFVAFTGAFHGRTFGALSLTPREKYQQPFAPLLDHVTIAPFNDIEAAARAITDETCAVMVEPVQGEGGIYPASDAFLRALRALCDQHGALLIYDEVQCGVGRTGTLWAHEASGVTPDIMTLAKPLAGGLPIGAALVTEAVASVMQPGDHGSTFAGGPLVCSAALTVLNRISQPSFLGRVQDVGAYFVEQLEEINSPLIREVRGRGLMIGLELSIEANRVVQAGYARGLIMVNAGPNVLRFVPPLIFGEADVDAAIPRLADILKTVGA